MDENSKNHRGPSPDHTPAIGRKEQQETDVIQIVPKVSKKGGRISENNQGLLIEYNPGVLTEADAHRLLQTLKDKGVNVPVQMPPAEKNYIRLFLEGVRRLEIQPDQVTYFEASTSEEAYRLILEQVEKTNIYSLQSTLPMKEAQTTSPVTPTVEEAKKPAETTSALIQKEQMIVDLTHPAETISPPKRRGRPPKYQTEEERGDARKKDYKRYAQSEKGKDRLNRYDQSEQGKDRHKRYTQSEQGKERNKETVRRFREKKKQQAGNAIFRAEHNSSQSS